MDIARWIVIYGHIIKPTEDFVTLHSSAAHLSKVK